MVKIDRYFVPDVNKKLSILEFDKNAFLLCVDGAEPLKYKISLYSKLLLSQIDGQKNIEAITEAFNLGSGANLTVENVVTIFNNQFMGYGVIIENDRKKVRSANNYLRLKFVLFPENLIKKILPPFLFLFSKGVFKALFVFCLVLMTIYYIKYIKFSELYFSFTSTMGIWFIIIFSISQICHELGHSGACLKYGAKSGPIGFGFYYLLPVYFADVSDAWRLKKSERLIIDMAGIYMQLIFCAVFILIFTINGNRFFLNMSFLVATTLYVHLNPFLRYDGYWALCDSLNIPNLRANANNAAKQLMLFITKKVSKWQPSLLNYFLVTYFLLYISFMSWFFVFIIFFKRNLIVFFPIDVYTFFKAILFDYKNINFEYLKVNLLSFVLPVIFYMVLFNYLRKLWPYITTKIKEKSLWGRSLKPS